MLSAHEADAGVPALNALYTNVEIYCCGKNRNANQQTNPAFEGFEKKKLAWKQCLRLPDVVYCENK